MSDVPSTESLDALVADMSAGNQQDPGSATTEPAETGQSQTPSPDAEGTGNEQTPATDGSQTQSAEGATAPDNQNKGIYTEEERKQFKDNAAFAQMRAQNTAQRRAIEAIAQSVGVNPQNYKDNTQGLLDAVMQRFPTAPAFPGTQQNMNTQLQGQFAGNQQQQQQTPQLPPELQQQVNQIVQQNQQLMQANEALQKSQAEFSAMQNFEKVKQEFGLNQEDLNTFADQLAGRGVNPFQNPNVDLTEMYKLLNADKIITQRVKEQMEQQKKQQEYSQQHATTPSDMQGNGGGTAPEKVTDDASFRKFMEGFTG